MLQLSQDAVEAAGGALVVVSKDSHEELANLARREGLRFTLLSDPGLALADELGLRHAGADPGGGDLFRPAVLWFDREGRLRERFLTEDWRERLDEATVVAKLRDPDAPR